MTYVCSACELAADIAVLTEQAPQYLNVHTFPLYAHGIQPLVFITNLCRQEAQIIQNHENEA